MILAIGTLATVGGIALGAVAVGMLLLATVPSRARDAARVAWIFLLVLSPVIAVGYGFARARFDEPLAWLALLPITITWLAILDLRWGVSGRVTKGLPRGAAKRTPAKVDDGPGAAT